MDITDLLHKNAMCHGNNSSDAAKYIVCYESNNFTLQKNMFCVMDETPLPDTQKNLFQKILKSMENIFICTGMEYCTAVQILQTGSKLTNIQQNDTFFFN
jgi:hypothetical protein